MDANAKRGAWIVTVFLLVLLSLGGLIRPIQNGPCRLDNELNCTIR